MRSFVLTLYIDVNLPKKFLIPDGESNKFKVSLIKISNEDSGPR